MWRERQSGDIWTERRDGTYGNGGGSVLDGSKINKSWRLVDGGWTLLMLTIGWESDGLWQQGGKCAERVLVGASA